MQPSSPTGPSELPIARTGWQVRLRRIVVTGLVILVPAVLTGWILLRIFDFMDSIFAPLVDRWLGSYFPGVHIPGLGFAMTALVVLILGWLSTNVVGRSLIHAVEALICRIPVAKSIYSATKGVLETLSLKQTDAFKRVVLIEYPKANIFAIAFVTGWAKWGLLHEKLADCLLVFVPTTPNPTSGFLLIVPRAEAIDLPISIEEGVRMVISGGILLPPLASSDPQGETPKGKKHG